MFHARTFILYKNYIRKTWSVINDTLQSNRRLKCQSDCIFGNRIIRDTDEIVNHFYDCFINISCRLHNKFSMPIHLINI